jgi:hypothetical protein
MNVQLERMRKEAVMAYLKALSCIRLEGLRKTEKHLNQVSGVSVDIRIGNLPNTCQQICLLRDPHDHM